MGDFNHRKGLMTERTFSSF